jgi:hypothetical protein
MVMFDWVLSFPLKTFQISSWMFFFFNIQVQSVLSAVGSIRNLNWFLLRAKVLSS